MNSVSDLTSAQARTAAAAEAHAAAVRVVAHLADQFVATLADSDRDCLERAVTEMRARRAAYDAAYAESSGRFAAVYELHPRRPDPATGADAAQPLPRTAT